MLNILLRKLQLVMFTGKVEERKGLFTAPGRAENKTKVNKMSDVVDNF